jgi:hypothetical protein
VPCAGNAARAAVGVGLCESAKGSGGTPSGTSKGGGMTRRWLWWLLVIAVLWLLAGAVDRERLYELIQEPAPVFVE